MDLRFLFLWTSLELCALDVNFLNPVLTLNVWSACLLANLFCFFLVFVIVVLCEGLS